MDEKTELRFACLALVAKTKSGDASSIVKEAREFYSFAAGNDDAKIVDAAGDIVRALLEGSTGSAIEAYQRATELKLAVPSISRK